MTSPPSAAPHPPSSVLSEDELLDRAWALHPSVAVRPESFGALLYHFGSRRLSFLKDRRLLDVVRGLATAPTARAACTEAGLAEDQLTSYARALRTLARTDMIRERPR